MDNLENLITILKKRKLSIAAAESCTGGYLSYLLTKAPGSSKVFKGAIVAYTLQAKNKLLKIPSSLLKKTDGVSLKVSLLLAKNIKKYLNSDIGVSIVGFAGPSAKKRVKVGTVFIAVADKKGQSVKKLSIQGNRDSVRKKASLSLINMLLAKLTKNID